MKTGEAIEILATTEDFEKAREIYLKLNGECGGQMTKMTRMEQFLVNFLCKTVCIMDA